MRTFNGREKCDCRYNLVNCARVIKISGDGVISTEGHYRCAKFTDKISLSGRKVEELKDN